MEHLKTYKIIVVGDSGVGKTSLMSRFADDTFSHSYISTIGVDFRMKTVHHDGKKVKLQIWDTAGQERFRTITSAYYRGANGIMLVYAVNDKESFEHVEDWLIEIDRYADDTLPPTLLVANKCDVENPEVTTESGESMSKLHNLPFIETSAKSATNVDSAFITLVRSMDQNQNQLKENKKGDLDIFHDKKKKRFSCF